MSGFDKNIGNVFERPKDGPKGGQEIAPIRRTATFLAYTTSMWISTWMYGVIPLGTPFLKSIYQGLTD